MTHDPDHDGRSMSPDPRRTNGLGDRHLDEAYRRAQRAPQDEAPWELRGAAGSHSRSTRRTGISATTRVIVALLLVAALVVPLIGRW